MDFASAKTTAPPNPAQYRYSAMVALAVVLIHAPLLTKPFVDSDEAVYASIAALSNEVGRLYAEGGVDNKFPGIYWIYAIVFRIFGQYSMNAVHAVTILVVLATSAVLGQIAVRIGHVSAAWVVALFYGVVTTFYTPKMLGANTEVFAMLPIAIAVLLMLPPERRSRPSLLPVYLAGMLIGLATLIRQLAGLNLALICAVPLFWHKARWSERLGAAVVAAIGTATVGGLLVYSFYSQGTLQEFWFWTVSVVRQRYLPDGWHFQWPWHQLAVLVETVVFWILIAQRARKLPSASFGERVVWAWLVLSGIIVVIPGRFHPHYAIQLFAPLAILSGIEFRHRIDAARERKQWHFVAWSAGLIGVLTVVYGVVNVCWEPFAPAYFSKEPPRYLEVARFVRETTAPRDRIFVWGAYTPIYVLSDRLPATRFVAFKRGCGRHAESPFADCWDSGPEMWPRLASDLAANSPAVIVDTAPANLGDFGVYPMQGFAPLRELLDQHYVAERTINGVVIYRRISSEPRSSSSPS